MLSVVRVSQSIKYDAGDDGGNRQPHRQGKPERLEIGGQQQKDDTHRHQKPQTQTSEHLRHRLDLPAHGDIHPIGRLSRIVDRLLHAGCRASQILAVRCSRSSVSMRCML